MLSLSPQTKLQQNWNQIHVSCMLTHCSTHCSTSAATLHCSHSLCRLCHTINSSQMQHSRTAFISTFCEHQNNVFSPEVRLQTGKIQWGTCATLILNPFLSSRLSSSIPFPATAFVCVHACMRAMIKSYWCLFLALSMDFYVCTMLCESCLKACI